MSKKVVLKFMLQLVVVIVVTSFIFTKVIKIVKVDGHSMAPTLNDGNIAIVNARYLETNEINRFDVVILKCAKLDKNIIKRVIGLPGDKVVYQDDKLYINNHYYDEYYLNKEFLNNAKEKYQTDLFTNDFSITLGNDEIFVLGDNRLQSADSRTLGTFKYGDIIGKKGLIIYPFKDMNFID